MGVWVASLVPYVLFLTPSLPSPSSSLKKASCVAGRCTEGFCLACALLPGEVVLGCFGLSFQMNSATKNRINKYIAFYSGGSF